MRLPILGFRKRPKISKVVSKDDMRPVLQAAYLRIENGRPVIYATDAYRFVKLRLEKPDEKMDGVPTEGPIPLIALKHMEQGVEFRFESENGEESVRVGLARYDRRFTEGREGEPPSYPEFEAVVPEIKRPFRVGMKASLMQGLAEAMGEENLIFEFDLDELSDSREMGGVPMGKTYLRAIRVFPDRINSDAEGLLMPVRITGAVPD